MDSAVMIKINPAKSLVLVAAAASLLLGGCETLNSLNPFGGGSSKDEKKIEQAKKYDNRLTCTLRAGYAGPFQSEGLAFATWMDACNAHGYTEMEKVMTGQHPMPTVEELIAELPTPPWPLPVVEPVL